MPVALATDCHELIDAGRLVRVARKLSNPLSNNTARLPGHPVPLAAMEALLRPLGREAGAQSDWHLRDGRHSLHLGAADCTPATVCIHHSPDGSAPTLLTLDVLLVLLVFLSDRMTSRFTFLPERNIIPLLGTQILRSLGIHRYGAERRHLEARVGVEIERLRRMVVTLPHSPRAHSLIEAEAVCVAGGDSDNSLWRLRCGSWVQDVDSRHDFMSIPSVLLTLDHRGNRAAEGIAKRTWLYLLFRATCMTADRSPGPGDDTLTIRVDELLHAIGEFVAPEFRGTHWAARTRTRLESALRQLHDLGLVTGADPAGMSPGGYIERTKGWVPCWLGSTLRLTLSRGPAAQGPQAGFHTRRSADVTTGRGA